MEHLTLEGRPAEVAFKRVRVQARQVYCFAQAHELGWCADAFRIAQRGVDLLMDRAWLGAHRGWASTLSRSGEVLDGTPDLYDTAFVLFALGWWFRISGDPRVVPIALETLDFLESHLRHPSQEGYLHRLGGGTPHLQNPHMHLLEAMAVLRDGARHPRFAEEVDRLVALCLGRFCDVASGTLAETFGDRWERLAGPSGLLLEPGHHYEWVWLLDQAQRGASVSDPRAAEAAMRALYDFAAICGQDASGLVVESVSPAGTIVSANHRLWPQVERIKAAVAMGRRHGLDIDHVVAHGVELVLRHHLGAQPYGTWIESFDSAMRPRADKIPASSFYHVVLAAAEASRYEEQRLAASTAAVRAEAAIPGGSSSRPD